MYISYTVYACIVNRRKEYDRHGKENGKTV